MKEGDASRRIGPPRPAFRAEVFRGLAFAVLLFAVFAFFAFFAFFVAMSRLPSGAA